MKKKPTSKNSHNDSGQIFRLLFETSFDGILVGLSDGTITAANPSACRMFEHSEEEICKLGCKGIIDPEDSRWADFLDEQVRTGRAQGKLTLLRKNGAKFPAEVSLSEFDDKSGCKKILYIFKDISKLYTLNQRIVTILDSITDIYIAYDREERITDINENAAIAMNMKRENIIGQYVLDVLSEDLEKKHLRKNREVLSTQKPMFYEAVPIFDRWYEVRVYPSENGLSTYSRDITERIVAQKQLKQKTERLEEVNTALKVLLKQLEDGRSDLEGKILANIRELVLPHIDKLESSDLSSRQLSLLSIAKTNLNNISSSFLQQLKLKHYNLTPREIEIATFVKEGKNIKDIAELLNVSIDTVKFHRFSLRKKLRLTDRSSNLRSHLLNFN